MDPYETFNDVLVRLFNEITEIEQKVLTADEFSNISNNDMHIIEAIGKETSQNMSSVAKSLHITLGTLTTAITSLVQKGYVHRERSQDDRRVVLLSLTESGLRAYEHHQGFHQKMVEAALSSLDTEETKVLVKALTNLSNYFRNYK